MLYFQQIMENLQHKKLVDTFFFLFSGIWLCEQKWAVEYKLYIYIYTKCLEGNRQKYKWFSMVDMNKIKIFYFYSYFYLPRILIISIIKFKKKGYRKFFRKKISGWFPQLLSSFLTICSMANKSKINNI